MHAVARTLTLVLLTKHVRTRRTYLFYERYISSCESTRRNGSVAELLVVPHLSVMGVWRECNGRGERI